MKIKTLSLTNFRAFKRLEIEFSDHLNLFIGSNAQGKTTILEAIHIISLLTSPLAGNDRELVSFLALEDELPVSRIRAGIEKNGKSRRIEIRLILQSIKNGSFRLKKELLIDGVQRRLYDFVGFFNSILFLPQMTRIIEDGPDERRKYLDQVLSQAHPGYVRNLSNYLKGIAKRNALLKQLNETGGDHDQLTYWDELIAETGVQIIQSRLAAIQQLGSIAGKHHRVLTHGKEELEVDYLPSFSPPVNFKGYGPEGNLKLSNSSLSLQELKSGFLDKLKTIRREEIARGVTTIGPHRDDIKFLVNQVDMGVYGSRGQIRTIVMALKFAEKDWFKEESGELPVILLDETLAELDNERRGDLLETLVNGGQAILTTADLELFDKDFIKKCDVWRAKNGMLTKAVF